MNRGLVDINSAVSLFGADSIPGSPSKARYFLCDQSMKSFSGHCYAYYEPVYRHLVDTGREAILIAHQLAEPAFLAATGAKPIFTFWCDERNVGQQPGLPLDENADIIRDAHDRMMLNDLTEIDRQYAFTPSDILVLNTVRHWCLRGVAQWVRAQPAERRPKVWVILHFTAQPDGNKYDPAIRHYRDGFAAIAECRPGDIRMMADATTLIEEYARLTRLPILLQPFPHTSRPPRDDRGGDGKLRIGYAGEARYHKGFHLLPFLAQALLQRPDADRLELHIHSFCGNPYQDFYQKSLGYLRALPNCTLYEEVMSPEDYDAFLARIDIGLIPYALENYHRQTSGVFAESMALATPVVVSRGTWMARELRNLGDPGEVCISDDYISLYEAVAKVVDNYDEYSRRALEASRRWRAFHSPQNLIDMFDGHPVATSTDINH